MTLQHRSARQLVSRTQPLLAYWRPEAIDLMVQAAANITPHGDCKALFIRTAYVGSLRVSEALALTPADVLAGPTLQLRPATTKGKKGRVVAITQPVADALLAYAHRHKLADNDRFFPFDRTTAWRTVTRAAKDAGCWVPKARTHLLRHSGAIQRLKQHGNPRALQLHLGHSRPETTMNYLVTLQVEDAVTINQQVDPEQG